MAGITLVELLMTLIIVSIVMVSIYNVLQHSLQAHSHVEAQAEVIQNARMGMERFSKELRQIGGLDLARADLIAFSVDSNGDGDYTDDGERIAYRLFEGKLERSDKPAGLNPAWRTPETIAEYVTGFTLSYRDGNNNILSSFPLSTTARNAVRLVSADISLEKTRRGAKGKEIYTAELRVTAHPRNR